MGLLLQATRQSRLDIIRERVQIFQAKCPILMYAYGRNLSV